MSKTQNLMTRQQKIEWLKAYMKGRIVPPVTGIMYSHHGKVFGYSSINERITYKKGEEVPVEAFRKGVRQISHGAPIHDHSKGL